MKISSPTTPHLSPIAALEAALLSSDGILISCSLNLPEEEIKRRLNLFRQNCYKVRAKARARNLAITGEETCEFDCLEMYLHFELDPPALYISPPSGAMLGYSITPVKYVDINDM